MLEALHVDALQRPQSVKGLYAAGACPCRAALPKFAGGIGGIMTIVNLRAIVQPVTCLFSFSYSVLLVFLPAA